jgi:hypothetical protein
VQRDRVLTNLEPSLRNLLTSNHRLRQTTASHRLSLALFPRLTTTISHIATCINGELLPGRQRSQSAPKPLPQRAPPPKGDTVSSFLDTPREPKLAKETVDPPFAIPYLRNYTDTDETMR